MSKDTWPPRCYFCGRFISYADMEADQTLTWTPYANALAVEPPPDAWAHTACYDKESPERQRFIERLAWHAPHSMRGLRKRITGEGA